MNFLKKQLMIKNKQKYLIKIIIIKFEIGIRENKTRTVKTKFACKKSVCQCNSCNKAVEKSLKSKEKKSNI